MTTSQSPWAPDPESAVAIRCDRCQELTSRPARFCRQCGAPLPADRVISTAAATQEVRKTVTCMFCDVVESTALGERLDPEAVRRVMSLYFDEMRRVVERHGGTVEKFIGDAVMAVFGVPRLHEDDALRAVRAAREMSAALQDLNEEVGTAWGVTIAARIGINTGEVVASETQTDQRLVTGDAVNVAARLEQHAAAGEILLGETTYRLVRDAVVADPLVPIALKGKAAPLTAYRLRQVTPDAPWLQRRLDAPIVGRAEELATLDELFQQCLPAACRLVTVIAPAGLGKSRLVREFIQRIRGRARVTRGRCLPYGEGVTYWPIAELVQDLAGFAPTDDLDHARARILSLVQATGAAGGHHHEADARHVAEVVAGAIGLSGSTAETTEIAWAARRLLETTAVASGPLVVVIEDIHWAEPALLHLIEHVATLTSDVPLLIVCTARPELAEVAPGWSDAVPHAVRQPLHPLGVGDLDALLDRLLDGMQLPEQLGTRIVTASEGNPLFVEELVRMLIDDTILVRTDDGWVATAELTDLVIPPSITAILASRLDRLETSEHALIQRAAVMGREFYREALEQVGVGSLPRLEDDLRSLVSKQLVQRVGPGFGGSETYRFFHLLTRDAAYASVPKEVRAELHERFADWLEAGAGTRSTEYEEIIGYHLEQAVRHLRELGRRDGRDGVLGTRAGRWLSAAGRRSLARDDMSAASNLLERAVAMLQLADPERPALLRDLATALVARGRFDDAEQALNQANESARLAEDHALADLAALDGHFIRLRTQPDGEFEEVRRATDDAYRAFSEAANDIGLARVWRLRAELDWMACAYGRTTEALDRALRHAHRAGEVREESAITIWLAACLALGPTPAGEAITRCHELLERARGSRRAEATVGTVLAYLSAMAGAKEDTRTYLERSRRRHEELGLTFTRAHWTVLSGMALLYIGDLEAAEAELRWGYETLRDMGERAALSTVAAYLARVLVAEGRYAEAEALTVESEQTAAAGDLASQIAWRGTRLPCRLAVGDIVGADELGRAALALAENTDDLELLGYAHAGLAAVMAAAGDPHGAAAETAAASAAYRAKGDVVSAPMLDVGAAAGVSTGPESLLKRG
ncbi:MAG TPA: adenylate/guanylate cyclase domain-containing protein [Actinomycetes bacterium]|nr:adenylate/guanylate cyclase domain-containing protein [Actinomycetes bacterium]